MRIWWILEALAIDRLATAAVGRDLAAWNSPHRIARDIGDALGQITSTGLRAEYDQILEKDSTATRRSPRGPEFVLGDDDIEYTWKYFTLVQLFFMSASDLQQNVVFILYGDC